MSDDSKPASKDVDIDELDIRIFMLVKDTNSMNSTSAFLKRRGWDTVCHNHISKAIDTIVKSQPEVVMVSVNHPNPNVMRLPTLLSQSMNAITIGFSEKGDSVSLNRLNNSKFQYKFSGYPSGPSFHRFIRQILDRTHNPHKYVDNSRKQKAKSSKDDNDKVSIKGSGSEQENMHFESDKKSAPITIKGADSKKGVAASGAEGPIVQKSGAGASQSAPTVADQVAKNKRDRDTIERKNSGPKSAADQTQQSNKTRSEEDARALERSSKPGKGSMGAGKFDDVDEQGFKRKDRPRRKMYPWQKEEKPQEDAIKNQSTRPGASFEKKQSRKDLPEGTEEKEKANPENESADLDVHKKSKQADGPDVSQEGLKAKEHEV
ncbi:MAG: hypothetical protein AAF202_06130, partial [Pseudomonadota bacterium]